MTRLFQTGAELGSLAMWSSVDAAVTATSAVKRSGSYSFKGYAGGKLTRVMSPTFVECYGRCAYMSTDGFTGSIHLFEAGVSSSFLMINDGSVDFKRSSTVLASSSIGLILPSQWNLLEWHLLMDDVNGVAQLKINGVLAIDFAGDTRNGTGVTSGIEALQLQFANGNQYFDDIALNDTLGTVNNSWIGNGYCKAIKANGSVSAQFVGSDADSTDNHLLVDDLPHDSDTTYVQSNTAGQRDVYEIDNIVLAANEVVNAVQAVAIARLDSAGDGALKVGISNDNDGSPTEVQSAATALATDSYRSIQKIAETDPDNGAWAQASLSSMRVTIEVA